MAPPMAVSYAIKCESIKVASNSAILRDTGGKSHKVHVLVRGRWAINILPQHPLCEPLTCEHICSNEMRQCHFKLGLQGRIRQHGRFGATWQIETIQIQF